MKFKLNYFQFSMKKTFFVRGGRKRGIRAIETQHHCHQQCLVHVPGQARQDLTTGLTNATRYDGVHEFRGKCNFKCFFILLFGIKCWKIKFSFSKWEGRDSILSVHRCYPPDPTMLGSND